MAEKQDVKNPNQPNEKGGVVINQIIVRPANRTNADIQNWRNYHASAENSINEVRVALYDLYEDCTLDAVLSDQIDQRQMAVTTPQLQFLTNGKEVEEVMALLDSEDFHEWLKEIVNTELWGYTVGEFNLDDGFKFFNIPRKHIRPKAGMIAKEQYGIGEINYRVPPTSNYIIELGKQLDLGKLVKACPYALYKRGGLGDLAQFSEIFGMPTRIAKYDAFNEIARNEAKKCLDETGSALGIVIPKEVEFSMEQPTANLTGEVYDKLISICDKQMMILIGGQTETTTSSESSGYAQSKTHMETKEEVQTHVRKYVLRVLNGKFKQLLELHGLPVKGGAWSFVKEEVEMTPTEKMTVWTQAKSQLGVPVNDDDVYEEFGIPKPKNYDELKTAQEEERQAQQAQQDSFAQNVHSASFWNRFKDFFASALK